MFSNLPIDRHFISTVNWNWPPRITLVDVQMRFGIIQLSYPNILTFWIHCFEPDFCSLFTNIILCLNKFYAYWSFSSDQFAKVKFKWNHRNNLTNVLRLILRKWKSGLQYCCIIMIFEELWRILFKFISEHKHPSMKTATNRKIIQVIITINLI